MQYDFKIRAEISHVKLISKALDILKSIAKGELTRAACLFSENKFTANLDSFDDHVIELSKSFISIQENHLNNKLLNILQLGSFGAELANVKQRFIDTGIIMKNKRLSYININCNKSEIEIIHVACTLYWKILISDFSFISSVIKHKCDITLINELLLNMSQPQDILSKNLHRKSKWAYDICVVIENIDSCDIIKNIGTLPKLKIIKNG